MLRRFVLLLFALVVPAAVASAVTLPPDFLVENATPGIGWTLPVEVAFLPDGRWLVAEKRGRVWVVRNGVRHPVPMWEGESEVLNHHDRGLLGLAVDPHFDTNRFIYLLYTVDPDSNGDDSFGPAFGRLTRYQVSASDSNVVDPATRTVLLGQTWAEGPLAASPSHTIGCLRFGTDGSLLVGTGDGANYSDAPDDGGDYPDAFLPGRTDPVEDIGGLRSQYLGSLAGKILRIDPATGHGYPSNPFFDGDPMSVRSRVWLYGVRNPFRFAVEPGSGSTNPADGAPGVIHLGDVGWALWEELDIATTGGKNFGWPCYEGPIRQNKYWAPLSTPAHCPCDSIALSFHDPADTTRPVSTWYHYEPEPGIPGGFEGQTALGGTFYTGRRYPPQYRNRLFMGDFGSSWIKVLVTDSLYRLNAVLPFADQADFPVEIAAEPISGDILYISISHNEIRRIRYVGPVDNVSPVAVAGGAPSFGGAPVAVEFSSAGTSDAENDSLSFAWLFGDGDGSSDPHPTHVYESPGVFAAVLTVTDAFGGLDRDTVIVTVVSGEGFPTKVVLDSFDRADEPLGPPWTDDLTALATVANRLSVGAASGGNASALWDDSMFGPVQEAFVTLHELPGGTGAIELVLQAQGVESGDGYLGVRYEPSNDAIQIRTSEPGFDPVVRATFEAVGLVAGDRLGARTGTDGLVGVYRNDELLGAASVEGFWPHADEPGRIGLRFEKATGAVVDDFGGGGSLFVPNTPPVAAILTPPDSSFFAEGDTVRLIGSGVDALTSADSLDFIWEVDTHHNEHTHPSSFTLEGDSAFFLGESHDDGSGVYLHVRFIVADSAGLADTASVDLFPEADLRPTIVSALPESVAAGDSLFVTLRLANDGRMLAHRSRWRLDLGGVLLAEGDTTVSGGDSVSIALAIGNLPAIAPGARALRLVADALGVVVETDETDNESALFLYVRTPPDAEPPNLTLLFPNGGEAWPLGAVHSVLWSASDNTGVTAVTVELSRDGGNTYALLDSGLAHTGELELVVTGPASDSVLVRVTARDAAGNTSIDVSDVYFAIVVDEKTPAVFLLSPNGGEAWPVGFARTIRWTAEDHVGVTAIDLFVSYDDGESYAEIAEGLPDTGEHDWVVAGPLTASARIQIIARDAVGNAAADASDAAFSLVDGTPPAFTLGPTATPNEADAAIAWQTDELATGCVRWGLTGSFGDSTETASPSLGQAVNLTGLTPEMTYHYCVVVRDTAGNVAVAAPDSFTTLASTVAADPAPHTLALSNPYPIPAHGHVSLVLDLPQRSTVDFAVYDVRGRRVWSSARYSREPGRWLLEWQGLDDRGARVPAGVYLACVTANGRLLSRRITLLSGER